MTWDEAMEFCSKKYGVFVDREERFFICPECDEPILAEDWEELSECPICEFDWIND